MPALPTLPTLAPRTPAASPTLPTLPSFSLASSPEPTPASTPTTPGSADTDPANTKEALDALWAMSSGETPVVSGPPSGPVATGPAMPSVVFNTPGADAVDDAVAAGVDPAAAAAAAADPRVAEAMAWHAARTREQARHDTSEVPVAHRGDGSGTARGSHGTRKGFWITLAVVAALVLVGVLVQSLRGGGDDDTATSLLPAVTIDPSGGTVAQVATSLVLPDTLPGSSLDTVPATTIAETVPPTTVAETAPPTTLDPLVARNDRTLDDTEWTQMLDFIATNGITPLTRDQVAAIGTGGCDLATQSGSLDVFVTGVAAADSASGLPAGQYPALLGAVGPMMCYDELTRIGLVPTA
ncbi:MAG: hypothetical protein U0Q03_06185 [Acidimicrobiales bacterium]